MNVHRAACVLSAHVFAMVGTLGDNSSLKVLVMAYISVSFPVRVMMRQNVLGIIYRFLAISIWVNAEFE